MHMVQGSAAVIDSEQEKAKWAGALVPAVELDSDGAEDLTVVVVRLIDERQAPATF